VVTESEKNDKKHKKGQEFKKVAKIVIIVHKKISIWKENEVRRFQRRAVL